MEYLGVRFRLHVPISSNEINLGINLVQNHNQQDADDGNRGTGQQELLATEQRTAHDIERVDVKHPGEEHPCCLPILERCRTENAINYFGKAPDNDTTRHPVNEHTQGISQQISANGDDCQPQNGEQQTDDVLLQVGNRPEQEGRAFARVLHACEQEAGTEEHRETEEYNTKAGGRSYIIAIVVDYILYRLLANHIIVFHAIHAGKEEVGHKHDECKNAEEANPRLTQYEELALL